MAILVKGIREPVDKQGDFNGCVLKDKKMTCYV